MSGGAVLPPESVRQGVDKVFVLRCSALASCLAEICTKNDQNDRRTFYGVFVSLIRQLEDFAHNRC